MGVRLPAEYQEVEYLESTGTQGIITDVIATNNIGFDCVYYAKSKIGTVDYGCIFGGRVSSGNNDFQLTTFHQSGSGYSGSFRFGSGWGYNANITRLEMGRTSFKNCVFVSNDASDIHVSEYNWTSAIPIALFLLNNNGTLTQGGYGCRIYVMRFYDGDSLIRDYVPCYRKTDSKPGMYDFVSKQFFVNQGTGEFIIGPDVIDSISPLMVAWRHIMMAAASVKRLVKKIITSTTGLVSFDTNVEMPTKVTCEFSPVQEGTGDPSPDNVRPISGWTGAEIECTNVNLSPFKTIPEMVAGGTNWITDYGFDIPCNDLNQQFTLTIKTTKALEYGSQNRFTLSGAPSTFVDLSNPPGIYSLTSKPRPAGYIRVMCNGTMARDTARNDCIEWIQLETGSSASQYDEHKAQTIPIIFTDPSTGDPLTVYGGTVTLNEDGSADLMVDRMVVDIPNLNWYKYGSGQLYFRSFGYKIDTSKVVCDIYKTVEDNFSKPIDYAVGSHRSVSYNQMLFIHDSRYETVEDFKAGSANTQLIINAESPRTYHFDNIGQLQSFLGTNNIWHDMNGGITVEYWNKQ